MFWAVVTIISVAVLCLLGLALIGGIFLYFPMSGVDEFEGRLAYRNGEMS